MLLFYRAQTGKIKMLGKKIKNKLESAIDNAIGVIAAFGGENGGTKNTIDYAKRKKIKIINIM